MKTIKQHCGARPYEAPCVQGMVTLGPADPMCASDPDAFGTATIDDITLGDIDFIF